MKAALLMLLVLLVAALAFGAWQLRGSLLAAPISGQVFAVENPDSVPADWKVSPLPGAKMLVMWRGMRVNNPVDSVSVCLRALRISAAPDGSFSVPEWRAPWHWPPVVDVVATAHVIEPGFVSVHDRLQGREDWMRTHSGKYVARKSAPAGPDVRSYLERVALDCELQ